MSREWRLNPPPNWPIRADAQVGLDWRPDPAWGPPPVGWQLWQRRRVTRRPALGSAGHATTGVGLTGAGLLATGAATAALSAFLGLSGTHAGHIPAHTPTGAGSSLTDALPVGHLSLGGDPLAPADGH